MLPLLADKSQNKLEPFSLSFTRCMHGMISLYLPWSCRIWKMSYLRDVNSQASRFSLALGRVGRVLLYPAPSLTALLPP